MNPNAGPGQQPGRPGQMTAVMRAVATQTGPKVLRIGLVQAGRVIEERIIKQRTSVSVGQSEKSTFVVPTPNIPPQFKLFELIGSDYYLNFVDGMNGRVALATGISDLAALRGQAKRVGPAYQVRLTDEARGKVIIGDVTFLFQFVAPPPPQPRPQLPLSVKGGLASQIDWTLTIIAAFSFMFHFGFIGAMYSDWLDPVVNEDNIASLIDMTKNLPPPPAEDKPDQASDQTSNQPSKQESKKPDSGQKTNATPGKISDQRAAALANEAQAMQMQMLAAFGGTTAVQGALNRSDVPVGDLSAVAQSAAGVTNTGGDLHLAAGGGATIPGQHGSLNQLGSGTGGGGGTAGNERVVQGPKGDAQTGSISTSAPVANAEATIARLRPGFRSCYNKGLSNDPSMAGKLVLAIKIAPNGDVTSVTKAGGSGLSSDVEQCIIRKAKNATFDAPGGSGSTVQVPVTFVKQ
ncbi:MAG TPA: AgmX/PglI C-terminal domain-containing protein [Polyangiaceae bacterium]